MTDFKDINKTSDGDFKKIIEYIESVHYGSVTIVVQGGKIVQIEKNEKIRIK